MSARENRPAPNSWPRAFAAYYAQTGGWTGVEAWMDDLAELQSTGRGQGRGQGQGQGQGRGTLNDRLLLIDASGQIVADSDRRA